MNPFNDVVQGAMLEDAQTAVATAEHDAASNAHYKGGYSARRRRSQTAGKRAMNRATNSHAAPTRFEGPAGAPWWKNPAWWIVGILAYKTLRKG